MNQKSISFDINEKIEVSKADSKRTSQKTRSDYKPVYMFNKLPGAPWVAKKIPSSRKSPKITTKLYFSKENFF